MGSALAQPDSTLEVYTFLTESCCGEIKLPKAGPTLSPQIPNAQTSVH